MPDQTSENAEAPLKIKVFNLANMLTLLNALCGCIAICMAIFGYFREANWFIIVSLVADFFDGFAARRFGGSSAMGRELDSLADAISFGFFPGIVLFILLGNSVVSPGKFLLNANSGQEVSTTSILLYATPFIVTLFSILRLAKFNIDTRQGEEFRGLATPASTLFVLGFMNMTVFNEHGWAEFLHHPAVILIVSILLSLMMIIDIPMFSFKFKDFGWKGNRTRYIFLIVSVAALAVYRFDAPALIILLYILISFVRPIFARANTAKH